LAKQCLHGDAAGFGFVVGAFGADFDANPARPADARRGLTPAELGEKARIPLLCFQRDVFDTSGLTDADWEITEFDHELTESEFSNHPAKMNRGEIFIGEDERLRARQSSVDALDSQLALLNPQTDYSLADLVLLLDREISIPYADRQQKVAWIGAAVDYLLERRGFTLDELCYRWFRLRGALERKLSAGLRLAKQRVFNDLFDDESRFGLRDEHHVTFEQGRYAYDWPYTGAMALDRHFFDVIGNLKDRGEEWECACFIANELEGVEWWVCNVERKKGSFWL
jgi:type III restriction enzyme